MDQPPSSSFLKPKKDDALQSKQNVPQDQKQPAGSENAVEQSSSEQTNKPTPAMEQPKPPQPPQPVTPLAPPQPVKTVQPPPVPSNPAPTPKPKQSNMLTVEQRSAILQKEIHAYLRRGFRVVSQTDTTAQLVKPKSFSCLIAVLLLVIGIGIGLLIYVLWYMASKDKTVYLEVDEKGRLRAR